MIVTPTITETAANYVDNLGGVALLISQPDSYCGRLALDPAALDKCHWLCESDDRAVVWTDCPMAAETLADSELCARIV